MSTPTPITLQEFNDNFTVRIVEYKDLGNSHIQVIFEVKCKNNGRVGAFTTDVDTTTLEAEYTTDDVISTAWASTKSNVNDWATSHACKPRVSTYVVSSVAENSGITLEDFNNNFTVQVNRFELYPSVNPVSWCIAFHIFKTDKPQINMYADGTILLSQHCNNVACITAVNKVWDDIKARACLWAASELAKASVLDTIYSPSDV